MSQALARKYRPATFDDLIGQEAVAQTLRLALQSKRLAHAYLFSGLRGSGKTSTARIFAKALLCEQGESPNPCGTCKQCEAASHNRHIDIIEMDAASNRGIDDIKDLIEHTKYKPSVGRYKIFIIDEVHMLTTQAFNALLKTLEEPPSFVKFILATTDPLKLPATILSRTQHFRFKKIPHHLLTQHLETILEKENVTYERDAVEIIARSGAGSVRDALTLLDQAIVYANHHIDTQTVTSMLGIIEPAKLRTLLETIAKNDQNAILHFIAEAGEFEAEMIIDELISLLKEMLLDPQEFLFVPIQIERFFRILSDAKTLLSIGSDGEFVLSLTLFKMVEAMQIEKIDQTLAALQTTTPDTAKTRQDSIHQPPAAQPSAYPKPHKSSHHDDSTQHALPNADQERFDALVAKIYDRDYNLGEVFSQHIRFVSFQNQTLTWESTAQDEAKKHLINSWGIIKLFVEEIYGVGTTIKNIAKKKPSTKLTTPPDATSLQAQQSEVKSSCVAPDPGDTEAAKEKDPATLLEEPMIKEALELLAPKKVRIKRKS